MKGMILVAGEGHRARPLTDFYAKPALPLPGGSILSHLLTKLRDSGIEQVALNLHYLPDTIYRTIQDNPVWNMRIHPFDEPEIAGSGGGFYRIRDFFGDEPFIILNGDTYSDFSIKNMVEFHTKTGGPATFLGRRTGEDKIKVINADEDGKIISIRKRPTPPLNSTAYDFCGAAIFNPDIFDRFPDKPYIDLFEDALIPSLEKGRDVGYIYSPGLLWIEFGNPGDYYFSSFTFLKEIFPSTRNSEECNVNKNFIIHKSAQVSSAAVLEGDIYIGPGSQVSDGAYLRNLIIPGRAFAGNSHLENKIILAEYVPEITNDKESIIMPDGNELLISY